MHTEYSLLDGAIRISELVQKTREMGMDSVAITDHGNIFAAVDFYEKAIKEGVKPILGCEVYVAPEGRHQKSPSLKGLPPSYHLVLLAMDEVGYKNLCKLITASYLEGFYYNPRVDMELLRELNQGLIAMSACLKGRIPALILEDQWEKAKEHAIELATIFDNERFFLEVMPSGLLEQEKVNSGLMELGRELGLPLVATNDCHYLSVDQAEAHDVLLCIQTGTKITDENRLRFTTQEFYFKSPQEMASQLPGLEEAIANTTMIASRCNFSFRLGQYKYPSFSVPEGIALEEFLVKKATEGLTGILKTGLSSTCKACAKQRGCERGPMIQGCPYWERLSYELEVINKVGFAGYFLIVHDFIEYARRMDIPVGPGRGSAAGSLVAYALGITRIDPLEYGLIFERFLNPFRISMPDIDIDFCINGRDEVIRYVANKYGSESVSQILTFGTMKARAVIRDVARCLGIDNKVADKIAKLVPPRLNITLDEAIEEEPELKRLEESGDDTIKRLLKVSRSLEGLSRHPSTHASGVVISDRPLVEYLPLYKGQKDEIMTHYSMEALERLGLIKFDFLGVKTLTVIRKTVELIKETLGIEVDVDKLDLEDEATYELISSGKTTGVFQLESMGMKRLLRKIRPKKFEDLIAILALYRPGPLGSNMVDEFIEGKNGKRQIEYLFPELEPILKETYGVMLYQEQAMKIAQVIANYSMSEADELRKAIGKKKEDIMARQRERFIQGALEKGFEREKVERLFDLISKFGGYGFNKSHSTAYAMVAFQTAYLKAHFPLHFMTALLSLDSGDRDKTIKNIAECRNIGIQILPPDINESLADFSITKEGIRFGLGAVKNVGEKAVEYIVEERERKGPFKDAVDFLKRMSGQKVTRKVIECLIEAGAFDFTNKSRARLMEELDLLSSARPTGRPQNILPFLKDPSCSMFSQQETPSEQTSHWSMEEVLRREKEATGFYITGHPMDKYLDLVPIISSTHIQDLLGLEEDHSMENVRLVAVITGSKLKKTKKNEKMAILQLEDKTGSIEALLFPDTFKEVGHLITSGDPQVITLSVESNEEGVRCVVIHMEPIHTFLSTKARALVVSFEESAINERLITRLERIFKSYRGHISVIFEVTGKNGPLYLKAGEEFKVNLDPTLLKELNTFGDLIATPLFY